MESLKVALVLLTVPVVFVATLSLLLRLKNWKAGWWWQRKR